MSRRELDTLCVNTLRMLAVDAIEKAKSGHPGMPMGAAAMAYVLWTRVLKHNPLDPSWPNRDRFVLSAGHASSLLYALLHLTGYDLRLDELKQFRQWGSRTPGHPEFGLTPGVETTTGPLGQGFANAVGMAMAERWFAATFNRDGFPIMDHYTYVIVGDGDLMEGISYEAASLAGHFHLGRLIVLYDSNRITIEGSTDLTFTEDVAIRFEAQRWQVLQVSDGNDLDEVEAAIRAAQAETARPSLIICRTNIGFGSPNKQDKNKAHGEPLGVDEVRKTKENLGWPLEPTFHVPEEVREEFGKAIGRGGAAQEAWQKTYAAYHEAFPDLAHRFVQYMTGQLPMDWAAALESYEPGQEPVATRVASGKVLQALFPTIKNLVGGSADLGPSNNTAVPGAIDFQAGSYEGRIIHFGVREHGMAAIANGMALHGLLSFCATFHVFTDYMKEAIRLAAMMGLRIIYILTHDSIGVGEDAGTHQPVEQTAALRAIPGLTVIRPCDAAETKEAWRVALTNKGPTCLVLSRQVLPLLDRSLMGKGGLERGAYVLSATPGKEPDCLLIATGSEVALATEARTLLEEKGVEARVISMPSWELFEAQSEAYKGSILPPHIEARISVEAGVSQGWHRYVGLKGAVIAIDRFGASAPAKTLFEKFGFTAANIVSRALQLLGK